MQDRIKETLTNNAVRIVDVFKEWDVDNSGTVSKAEFRKVRRRTARRLHRPPARPHVCTPARRPHKRHGLHLARPPQPCH